MHYQISPMREPPISVSEALQRGERQSRAASTPPDRASPAVQFWRRHKWKVIGLLIFLLFDLVLAGGIFNGHF